MTHQKQSLSKLIMSQVQNADVLSVNTSSPLKTLGSSNWAPFMNMVSIPEMRLRLEQEMAGHKGVFSTFPNWKFLNFCLISAGCSPPLPPNPYFSITCLSILRSLYVCMCTLHTLPEYFFNFQIKST